MKNIAIVNVRDNNLHEEKVGKLLLLNLLKRKGTKRAHGGWPENPWYNFGIGINVMSEFKPYRYTPRSTPRRAAFPQ